MQQGFLEEVRTHIYRNKIKQILRKFVHFLCCVVVFCTTYALILPAITLEQTAYCGLEEHTHSEECYQYIEHQELICNEESLQIHSHNESCYDSDANLVCGLADYVVHTHAETCFHNGQLVCTLPERSAHVHNETCYIPGETEPEVLHMHMDDCYTQQNGELICNIEAYEGHAHDDLCYVIGNKLTCTLVENHVHQESCYTYPLICTLSTDPHIHTEDCYGIGEQLCTTEEGHVHGSDCSITSLSCENTEEGHEHNDSCYHTEVICTIPENHFHDSSCYSSVILCGKTEGEFHEHGADCYSAEPHLTCTLTENHFHDDNCYAKELICTVPEDPGHSHTDDCYQQERVLTCGMEEGQPEPTEPAEPILNCTEPVAQEHVHGESCFITVGTEPEPICGITEEGHVHTEDCYGCAIEEHTHTLACYSDPEADVESAAVWESTFAHVALTGDWPTDVVAIAQTQIGYTESTRNYEVWEDNSIHGYTRYGDWYGVPYGDWCGMFASFCLDYAGVEGMPYNYGVRPWIEDLASRGLYYSARETKAQKGNLIFFDWEGDGLSDHVGIVAEVQEAQEHTGASVKTIEGNSGNAVRYQHYDPNDPVILGYGLLPGQERIPIETEEESSVYYCGLEEHIHEDACYDAEGTLLCELTEHSHTDTCLEKTVVYGCGLEEHTHTESCYDSDGQLICDLEEHIHTESCLEEIEGEYQINTDINLGPVVIITAEQNEMVLEETTNVFEHVMMFAMSREGPKSLTQYLAGRGENYFFSLTLPDGSTPVPKDEVTGQYIVTAGTQYKLTMTVDALKGIEPGSYFYELPAGLSIVGGQGDLKLDTGEILGSWEITNDGTVLFNFNDNANTHTNVLISAGMGVTFSEKDTPMDFDGKIFVQINPPVYIKEGTALNKWGSRLPNSDRNAVQWTVEIEGNRDSDILGNTITDTITSGHHSYTDADMQNGLQITAEYYDETTMEEPVYHNWTVHPGDTGLTWTPQGWSYTMPNTVNCNHCGTLTLGNDNWKYSIVCTTTANLPDGYDSSTLVNYASVDGREFEAYAIFSTGIVPAAIVKDGSFLGNTEGGKFRWEVSLSIPGTNTTGQITWGWFLADRMELYEENNHVTNIYNDIGNPQVANVTLKYPNGDTITVPHIWNSTGKEPVVWYNESGEDHNRNIQLFCRCDCTPDNCHHWYESGCGWQPWITFPDGSVKQVMEYCPCWTIEDDVQIIFTYETPMGRIDEAYTNGTYKIKNTAQLFRSGLDENGKKFDNVITHGQDVEELTIPSLFKKTLSHAYDGYTAAYTITVNEGKVALTDGSPLRIHDVMTSTLAYARGSMVITTEDKNGNTGTLKYGEDYTLTYDGSGNQTDTNGNQVHILDITILRPEAVKYTLNYDTVLVLPEHITGSVMYSNYATVSIWGQSITSDSIVKELTDFNFSAKKYSLSITKKEAGEETLLPGAVFGLYTSQDILLDTKTTGADGKVLFQTSLVDNIILTEHQPFYIQEISAPEGYMLDSSKYWFYFCDSGDACDKGSPLKNQYENITRLPGNIDNEYVITNIRAGYELPSTGGTGYELYTAGGTLLMLAALILLYNQKKCRKEDFRSS